MNSSPVRRRWRLLLSTPVLLSACAGNAQTASIEVLCNEQAGQVRRTVLGVNAPDKYLDWAANSAIGMRLRQGGFGAVRVGLVQDGLYQKRDIYPARGTWRFAAADRMLRTILDSGAEPIVSIIGFPAGVPHRLDDKTIGSADWKAYAAFMTGVVRHYNVDRALGRKILYWEMWNEPFNEPDGRFTSKEQYAQFVREVGSAMKRVDPTIRLIGPADAWSDLSPNGLTAYSVANLGSILDVLCWHDYGGQGDQSDRDRMAWPKEHFGANPRTVASGGSQGQFRRPSGKPFGTAITEYNMSWDSKPPAHAAKYHTSFNAAYIGASLVNAIDSDLELFAFYDLMQAGGNQLGLLDNKTCEPWTPFYVFPLFAEHIGNTKLRFRGACSDVEILATRKKNRISVIAVNTSTNSTRSVSMKLVGQNAQSSEAKIWQVSDRSHGSSPVLVPVRGQSILLTLPPLSVTAIDL